MHVVTEKGTLLACAMLLISAGVERCLAGEVLAGALLIVLGLALLFVREHLKIHRWTHTSSWHGKPV